MLISHPLYGIFIEEIREGCAVYLDLGEKWGWDQHTSLRRSILLSKHKDILSECLFEVIGFEVEIEIESVQSDNEIFKTPIKEEAPLKHDAESDKRKEIINKQKQRIKVVRFG